MAAARATLAEVLEEMDRCGLGGRGGGRGGCEEGDNDDADGDNDVHPSLEATEVDDEEDGAGGSSSGGRGGDASGGSDFGPPPPAPLHHRPNHSLSTTNKTGSHSRSVWLSAAGPLARLAAAEAAVCALEAAAADRAKAEEEAEAAKAALDSHIAAFEVMIKTTESATKTHHLFSHTTFYYLWRICFINYTPR
jgi:hypothetical protein